MRVAYADRPVIGPRTAGGEDYRAAFDLLVVDLPVADDAPPAEPLYVPMVFDTAGVR